MKKVLILFLILFCQSNVFAFDQYVSGYTKNNGTYVQPHYQTKSDNYTFNNYSTAGNTNPYTGKRGYVNPYNSPNSNSQNNYTYGNYSKSGSYRY